MSRVPTFSPSRLPTQAKRGAQPRPWSSTAAPFVPVDGDIVSVAIRSDGYSADVVVKGYTPTSTTYAWGLTGTVPGTMKVAFTVVSMGYDASGNATTVTRTVYGTKEVRKAYPDNAVINETNNGDGTMTVRIALSEPIFAKDKSGGSNSGTDPKVTFLSGWLTKSALSSNARANISCTNNSTLAYPVPVVKKAWFNYEKVSASTYNFEIVPVGYYVQSGRPFACVRAQLTDESSNVVNATITQWGASPRASRDAVTTVTCSHQFSLSTLDKHELCTIQYQVYPWIGDSSCVVDSTGNSDRAAGVAAPVRFLNDKDSDYPSSIAYVQWSTSTSYTGVAAAIGDNATARANPHPTIWKARQAIIARNLAQYGRADLNGGIIYLMEGSTEWCWRSSGALDDYPSAGSVSNTDKCELLITRDPLGAKANVVLNLPSSRGVSQSQIKTQNYRISDITITNAGTDGFLQGMNDGTDHITLDQVTVNQPTNVADQTYRHAAVTHIGITNAGGPAKMGFAGGTVNSSTEVCILARGNNGAFSVASSCNAFIGNLVTGQGALVQATGNNQLIWMNRVENGSNGVLLTISNTADFYGFICVGNCFVTRNTSTNGYGISNEGATHKFQNAIIAFNSFLGQGSGSPYNGGRTNFMYNESSTQIQLKDNIFNRSNYYRQYNHKNDVYATSALAINNWFVSLGCSQTGNIYSEVAVNNHMFMGLYTVQESTLANLQFSNPTDNTATDGGFVPGSGSTLLNKSLAAWAFLPLDIAGTNRKTDGTGAAGAYETTS